MHHYYVLLINIMRVRGKGDPLLTSPRGRNKSSTKGHESLSWPPRGEGKAEN